MSIFNRKTENIDYRAQVMEMRERTAEIDTSTSDGQLLRALVSGSATLSKEQALQIPSVAACVRLICDTAAMVPIRLYKVNAEKMMLDEVEDDPRTVLLNTDTGDTLDAVQFKKAMVKDYLLDKGGYAYIEKRGNRFRALRYVETGYIGFSSNADPIFKEYDILVNGSSYRPYEFLKVLRNTVNGREGVSVIEENAAPLYVAWLLTQFQARLLKTGGAKKGFVKSSRRLSDDAIRALKEAWARLYADGTENVIILNEGLDFNESSATSVEMQVNESANTISNQICQIFGVPPAMLSGGSGLTKQAVITFIQYCIQPILTELVNALNRDLLLESEKGQYKFAADISEFTKADILERYQAYEIASKNGFMQIDEVRFKENLEPLGLDFVKLGLQDVLYYPDKDGLTFMPNMNQVGGIKLAMEDREKAEKAARLQQEIARQQLDDTKAPAGSDGNMSKNTLSDPGAADGPQGAEDIQEEKEGNDADTDTE